MLCKASFTWAAGGGKPGGRIEVLLPPSSVPLEPDAIQMLQCLVSQRWHEINWMKSLLYNHVSYTWLQSCVEASRGLKWRVRRQQKHTHRLWLALSEDLLQVVQIEKKKAEQICTPFRIRQKSITVQMLPTAISSRTRVSFDARTRSRGDTHTCGTMHYIVRGSHLLHGLPSGH